MPLFHPRVLKQAIIPQKLPEKHKIILKEWHLSIESGKISKQKETSLHAHFIQKILIDILEYQGFKATESYSLYQECPIGKGSVDVALGHFIDENRKIIAPFELKGAKTKNLDAIMPGRHKSPVQQAWEYAMDAPGAKWVLVSNYLEIRLYAVGYGRQVYEKWDLAQLSDPIEYARFILLLSQKHLLGNQTELLLKESEQIEKEITVQLYQDYKNLRYTLIETLKTDNPECDDLKIITYAQCILDRILFIAFAEDTGLLPRESLKRAYEYQDPYNPRTIWENFQGLFRAIDQGNSHLNIPAYNGGLFKENADLNALIINDSLCKTFKKIGEYDFASEVSVTVLGHIFEQSIVDLEELRAKTQDKSVEIGKRKREGVVYTPDNITRFIVEQTLGNYLTAEFKRLWAKYDKKTTKKSELLNFWREYQAFLKTLKIVDPACGSGAFLVAAFDYLYAEYTRINEQLESLTGSYDLFDLDKEILNRNLYGVDVNSESIEITQLSLWLKTAKRGKILNRLDKNLRVGDSLVEDSNIAYRAFTWKKAFPEVFEAGGFDIVLGNPPYVRQELISHLKPYLQHQYEVYHGVADLYSYFFERGLRLLKSGGKLGYICSSTFFKTGSGEPLRRYVLKNATIENIIDFGDLQIFKGVTTYPAILIMVKDMPTESHEIDFLKLTHLPDEELSKIFHLEQTKMPQSRLNVDNWRLEDEHLTKLRQKIVADKPTLKEVYGSPLYGIKTGFNKAFVIDRMTRDQLIAQDAKSAEVIKPFLEGKDFKMWRAEPRDLYLILIPKGWTRKKADLIEEFTAWKWLKHHYPAIAQWLAPFENKAKKRTDKGDFWWELRACAYYEAFEKPKIIWSNLQNNPKFSFDTKGFFINAPAVILPSNDNFLSGLLNSNVIWLQLKNLAITRMQGFLEAKPVYIKQLPIPPATDTQKAEIATLAENCQKIAEARYQKQDAVRHRIPDLCPTVPKLNTKLKNWWTLDFQEFRKEVKKCFKTDIPLAERNDWDTWLLSEKEAIIDLTQQLEQLEQHLNQKIYALFELTEDEIRLVEENI